MAPGKGLDAGGEIDAVVVGAGFSGLYALHYLRDVLGLRTVVFEAGDGVGGTWFWNRYPGARCDSESHYYSYSFSPELEQEWEWSSKYPEQPEILRYLNHVADRFELRRDIRLSTRVSSATWDESAGRWEVTTESGEVVRAQYFVSAVGCLSSANVPDIPGLDRFEGEWYHTGAWPHEGVDFAGKRVGLIGTGSTGIQATPVIAAEADHLTVFQRTPNYSVPARNAPLTPEETARVKAEYRAIREKARRSVGGYPFDPSNRSALEDTPEARQALYEALWAEGGFKFLYGSYFDLLINEESNETAAEFIRSKIREIVKDPETADKLCPKGYPYATKRPPIDTGYFETFNRDNVSLVDLQETPIVELTAHGVRTTAEEHPIDLLVLATGFDAMTGSLLRMNISGRDGVRLADVWAEGPRTYLGLQVAGFPNFFVITGPGSPSVLVNMPVAIEQHVEWVGEAIRHLREHDLATMEPTLEAQNAWVDQVNAMADFTLYPQANSWYLGANIPGKKRVFMPYVGGFARYEDQCKEVVEHGYEGFVFAGGERAPAPAAG